ncbi:hypothetical protein WME76_19255 [Sorangium sp. So ce119]|uniref:hypothetical protein n=1 Tax=Sorangium sp. So ce119 TaxID=3133279 RepID=UPI003F60F8BA
MLVTSTGIIQSAATGQTPAHLGTASPGAVAGALAAVAGGGSATRVAPALPFTVHPGG